MGKSIQRSNKLWDEWTRACEALRAKPPRRITREELSQLKHRVLSQCIIYRGIFGCYFDNRYENELVEAHMLKLEEKIEEIFEEYLEVYK